VEVIELSLDVVDKRNDVTCKQGTRDSVVSGELLHSGDPMLN
jgi:hypothetical protein